MSLSLLVYSFLVESSIDKLETYLWDFLALAFDPQQQQQMITMISNAITPTGTVTAIIITVVFESLSLTDVVVFPLSV